MATPSTIASILGNPVVQSVGSALLPDDPYYKVRRQAELAQRASALSSPSSVGVPSALAQAQEITERPTRMVDQVTRTASQAMANAAAQPTGSVARLASLPVTGFGWPASTIAPASMPPTVTTRRPTSIPRTFTPTSFLESPAPEDVISEPADAQEAAVADADTALAASVSSAPVPIDSIVNDEQQANESWLRRKAPKGAIEFKLAAKRLDEASDLAGYEQSAVLAQGLEAVRRGLNRLADALWPPEKGKVKNRFGEEARVDEGGYGSRLSLCLQSSIDSKGQRRLTDTEVELHYERTKQLIARIAAGVHSEHDFAEARNLYVGAWQIVATARVYPAPSKSSKLV